MSEPVRPTDDSQCPQALDLHEQYRRLVDAALFAVTASEDARPLLALDGLLKPWIRANIERTRHSILSADSRLDVADDTQGPISAAYHYLELRRQLFSDLHHYGPQPPWRLVGGPHRGDFAVRASSQARTCRPVFALRAIAGPATEPGTRHWEFTVVTHDPADPAVRVPVRLSLVETDPDRSGAFPTVRLPDDLRAHPDWIDQLDYGFHALGHKVYLHT
jgi:hypothetical protein